MWKSRKCGNLRSRFIPIFDEWPWRKVWSPEHRKECLCPSIDRNFCAAELLFDLEFGFAHGSGLWSSARKIVLVVEKIGELEPEISEIGGIGEANLDFDDARAD